MRLFEIKPFAAALGAMMVASAALAAAPGEIRIGYAISKTGPYAGGASTTVLPNYQMWAAELEEVGGIEIDGKRVPVKFFEYDDRSSSEEAVRAVERLINQDKVDFILPPWGTAMNLAVGPVLDRHGYPHLTTTMISDRIPQLQERWPNLFAFTLTSSDYAHGVVNVLKRLRDEGRIASKVAMVNVADQFGVELAKAARTALAEEKFDVVYDQSYPLGSQDLQNILNEVRRREPDAFLAFSYPPDTLALNDQAQAIGFNPKVFYTAIGTVFPVFKDRFGQNTEGVLGLGGMSPDVPSIADYRERHEKMFDRQADYNGSVVTYATLQILQQAIERTGGVDRKAVENGAIVGQGAAADLALDPAVQRAYLGVAAPAQSA
ncbi:ABC transporter substrate-binding protein [Verticiella sediminum]|uniref:ABC transporter substrate-binding protein n=1 Tax=Verticiella sediminum TaxID=1247510 RepID=A0A556A900_9BURK|nr:amino acid ABC transporter substrate-binding protein [Verticiella sediminum]TSH89355.1 ABC transporter substrate-binding protein [Verticiella sediminum]